MTAQILYYLGKYADLSMCDLHLTEENVLDTKWTLYKPKNYLFVLFSNL